MVITVFSKRWFDTVINFSAIWYLDSHILVLNFDVKTLQKDRLNFLFGNRCNGRFLLNQQI